MSRGEQGRAGESRRESRREREREREREGERGRGDICTWCHATSNA